MTSSSENSDSWQWPSVGQSNLNKPILSECREVVLVHGGLSEKIRRLEDERPDVCWRYSASELLIDYYFNKATTSARGTSLHWPSQQTAPRNATLPIFYAFMNHKFSPYEFSVQPKPLDGARESLQARLQVAYSDDVAALAEADLFVGAPCVVIDPGDGLWHRAQVTVLPPKAVTAAVRVVDWGNLLFVPVAEIKPLFASFGRIPPLALPCRLNGVDINDLHVVKVNEFNALIDEVDSLVRVELVGAKSTPFMVNLFHPTIAGWNLGRTFLPPPPPPPPQPKPDSDEHFSRSPSDSDSGADVEPPSPQFVVRLERPVKPGRQATDVTVSHVENVGLIYLQTASHVACAGQISSALDKRRAELRPLPARALLVDTACAAYWPSRDALVRAVVKTVDETSVRVQAVDFGHTMTVPRAAHGLLMLPNGGVLTCSAQVWIGRLDPLCDEYPSVAETRLLREILAGETVEATVLRRDRGPPHRVKLTMKRAVDGEVVDAAARLVELMAERHVIRSKELVPFAPHYFMPQCLPEKWREELGCCWTYTKGRLMLTSFD